MIRKNFKSENFDVVTMWDVLEHVENPKKIVNEIHRILKHNGMVFIYVPNFDSFEVKVCKQDCDTIVPDAHLTYFDKNTIKKLEKLYKTKKYSHKRIWQVGMIMYVRLKAIKKHRKTKFKKAKNISSRYNISNRYFKFLGKRSI